MRDHRDVSMITFCLDHGLYILFVFLIYVVFTCLGFPGSGQHGVFK